MRARARACVYACAYFNDAVVMSWRIKRLLDCSTVDAWGGTAADKWLCSQPCTQASPCLFNLTSDVGETTDVAALHPEVVASMKARLAQHRDGYWYVYLVILGFDDTREKAGRMKPCLRACARTLSPSLPTSIHWNAVGGAETASQRYLFNVAAVYSLMYAEMRECIFSL